MADIVPFGKYKNQPIEVLAQDKSYCEWLAGQGWVAQRYPDIHTVIINNFAEPAETPEHNALQLRFLDEGLRLKVAMCLMLFRQPMQHAYLKDRFSPFLAGISQPMFEQHGIDVQWQVLYWYPTRATRAFSHIYRGLIQEGTPYWTQNQFIVAVECKPSLGDDYPAVLRFLHGLPASENYKPFAKVVIAETFTFRGGTLQQVQTLFQASGVLLLEMAGLAALPPVMCLDETDLPPIIDYISL